MPKYENEFPGESRGPVVRRFWTPAFAGALLLAVSPVSAQSPDRYTRALAAGYKASFLCSDLFNAGQSVEQPSPVAGN